MPSNHDHRTDGITQETESVRIKEFRNMIDKGLYSHLVTEYNEEKFFTELYEISSESY